MQKYREKTLSSRLPPREKFFCTSVNFIYNFLRNSTLISNSPPLLNFLSQLCRRKVQGGSLHLLFLKKKNYPLSQSFHPLVPYHQAKLSQFCPVFTFSNLLHIFLSSPPPSHPLPRKKEIKRMQKPDGMKAQFSS